MKFPLKYFKILLSNLTLVLVSRKIKKVCRSIIIIKLIIIKGIILSLCWKKFVVNFLFIYQAVFRQLLKFTAYNLFRKISTNCCPARGTEVPKEKILISKVCKILPLNF